MFERVYWLIFYSLLTYLIDLNNIPVLYYLLFSYYILGYTVLYVQCVKYKLLTVTYKSNISSSTRHGTVKTRLQFIILI